MQRGTSKIDSRSVEISELTNVQNYTFASLTRQKENSTREMAEKEKKICIRASYTANSVYETGIKIQTP